jgi:hypothetical protein
MARGSRANSESGAGAALSDFEAQSDKNVSRETFLSGQARKPYKAAYVGGLEARAMARKKGTFDGSRAQPDATDGFERELTFERLLALDPTHLRSAPCLIRACGVLATLDRRHEPT